MTDFIPKYQAPGIFSGSDPSNTLVLTLLPFYRGDVGPAGPTGPAGAAVRYEHTQASASTLWVVAHNLGYRPSVTVLTVGGIEIFGAEVQHLSANTLNLSFDVAFSGTALCI